ncbi:alkaline phosphatase D family protein [Novipirellula rosea]
MLYRTYFVAAALFLSSLGIPPYVVAQSAAFHAQGEFAGEVTATSVLLQTRLTSVPGPTLDENSDVPGAEGNVQFEYSQNADFDPSQKTAWLTADAKHDFVVRCAIESLLPDTQYYYRVHIGTETKSLRTGPVREFKTLPAKDQATNVTFCMGSCMNYDSFIRGKSNGGGPVTASAEDKQLGYPVFDSMSKLEPRFFVGTGDIVYYDKPNNAAAKQLPELRRKWHEQFRFPRLIEFFGKTPAYWSKDDHDFRFNDADMVGEKKPTPQSGIELFREQMPIHAADDHDSPTYRTHRIGRDLQLWFTEGRDFRSPNRMEDGPDKSLWGKEQREWLEASLQESDAAWKIIISPTPMVGPDDAYKKDNHTNLGGFRHEADSFFAWANEHGIENLMVFCGDRHWQYHSIHPSGVEEFGCGALNDENSRRGVPPGSKRGTDPDGKIVQPYTYNEPTGGFLFVSVSPDQKKSKLQIQFHDDHGELMYEVAKER